MDILEGMTSDEQQETLRTMTQLWQPFKIRTQKNVWR
jgi:hypothetical protein